MGSVTLVWTDISPDFKPNIDTTGRINTVVAVRRNASEYVDADTSGPLGTAAIGIRRQPVNVNPATDDALPLHAHHHLVLGTDPDPRYPTITVNLDAAPGLTEAVSAIDVGDKIELRGIPEDLGQTESDVLVLGYTELIGSHSRVIAFNSRPGGILSSVGVLDGGATACLQTRGAQLGAAITDTQSSFLVATTAGSLFTTSPPAGARIVVRDREVMPVASVASSIRSTFNGTAVSGWDTLDTGQAWVVGAGTAANFSESTGAGRIAISATNVEHHIAVNLAYAPYQRVRVYNTLAVTPIGAAINWGLVLRRSDSSNLYWIDVQVGTTGVLTLRAISKIAGANVQLATTDSATVHSTSVARILVAEIDDDDVIRAKVWADGATEPDWELVHQASHVDLQTGPSVGCIARLMTGNSNATPVNFVFDNFAVLNPQLFMVTRDPEQRMAHPVGEVSVYRPLRLTL